MTEPTTFPVRVLGEAGEAWAQLACILEGLLPVKFARSGEGASEAAAEIILGAPAGMNSPARGIPRLYVPMRGRGTTNGGLTEIQVMFADESEVPFPFRGRTIQTKVSTEPNVLTLGAQERALANTASGPVWAVSVEAGVKQFKSGLPLPEMPPGGNLSDVLNGGHFFEALPFVHWLREVCAGACFDSPPLRACFIFDDPNLHWPRYGFVDFQEIATHAARENYHVAFATVPLDGWFAHQPTTEIFRTQSARLSLAVHGNDHTKHELARNYTPAQRVSLLRQADQRIARLERRTGLEVCRVMVPPHGACSDEMLASLPACGFEGACISHGSLRAHNKTKPWTKSLGFLQAELIRGCPVLPRWGMSGDLTNTILLAAFLNQAIILRGHHRDLKDGVGLLDQWAQLINSLGAVSWLNLSSLSRMNYQSRLEGTICRIRPLAPRVTFPVPRAATHLLVEGPRDGSWPDWQVSRAEGAPVVVSAGKPLPCGHKAGEQVSIRAVADQTARGDEFSPGTPVAAFIRRLATEGRDRLLSF